MARARGWVCGWVYLEWLRTIALLFERPNDDGLEAGEGMWNVGADVGVVDSDEGGVETGEGAGDTWARFQVARLAPLSDRSGLQSHTESTTRHDTP